jgi:hypothetical protein
VRLPALAAASLLCWSATALAQEAKPAEPAAPAAEAPKPPPPQFKFEFHGFVSASLYAQDANLGPSEGQQALFVNAQTPATTTSTTPINGTTVTAGGAPAILAPNTHKVVSGADVRQSRFNFSLAGPQVLGGATPKAVLEFDFFGGFGSGNYGDASLVSRLRFAYGELNWGSNRIQVGQNNDLIFAIAPVSLAHIAFPYGYGSGNIGWRRPGLFGYHTAGPKTDTNFEFAWEVGRANWADNGGIGGATVAVPPANPGGDKYGFNLGEASSLPAVEARLTVASGTLFSAFVTGHWQREHRNGIDDNQRIQANGINTDLDTMAANVGGKVVAGPLTLAATGFVGKNLSPLIGNFLQFQANTIGDIHEMGGWVQAGFNFTKQLSLWGFIGADVPKQADAIAAKFTKLHNVTSTGMLQYREGGWAMGLEWIHLRTLTRNYAAAATKAVVGGNVVTTSVTQAQADAASGVLNGNQVMLTANYFF